MDTSDCEKKKRDKQGTDFDILRKDEAFWQKAVRLLSKNEISEAKIENAENDNKEATRHPEKVFNVHCKCNHCRVSRELIVGTFVENCAYNQLWSKLQEIIRSYYTFLPACRESIMNRKYQELQSKSCGIRWCSDGSIDVKKNIHVSMGSYFSISNEMTFMIVFNMLYARDRHQLFELLCLELTSIILSYRESIKEITRCAEGGDDDDESFKPDEFLDYVMNGYDRIQEIAETQTPLIIEMREHLGKFSLTWKFMNQCMYFRFLYVDVESLMADCILKLKDVVSPETYKNYVYRFIKFDEEMTSVGDIWEVALVGLDIFRKSAPEQVNRVERINMIRQIQQSLRDLKELPVSGGKPLGDQVLALDWIVSSVKDDVWLSVINSIRREPLFKNIWKDCKCWACTISYGNSVTDICAIPRDDSSPNNAANSKMCVLKRKRKANEDYYHLAWAVFKHLNERQPYRKQFFHPEVFCVFNEPPCERMECLVATNLIVGAYPLSFTKFLIRNYVPLSLSDREKFLKVPSQSLVRKFCRKKGGAAAKEILHEADEINHTFLLLNMFWDDEDITDPVLRTGLAAALAENFKIEVTFPQKHTIFSYFYALFRLDPKLNDIVLDLAWLEQINLANLFKSFSSNLHDSVAHPLNLPSSIEQPIEMHLNEVKITAEVSAGGSSALDLVQFSMKEVADKLNSITLTDDNESTKAVIENEIKKPLVEALKLAASNKKLEAELKSLQKEHNMLKDMVRGLEQIHGEKKEVQVTVTTTTTKASETQASNTSGSNAHSKCGLGHSHSHSHGHSHSHSQSGCSSPSIAEDHGKDDCVCYYCTLFGKNQDLAANPRSTEARDRLRKKLHHLQSQKDFSTKSKNNLKNISLLLKNGATPAPAKSSASTNAQKSGGETVPTPPPKSNGTVTGSMKMKVELEVQHRKKKTTIIKPTYASKPDDVKIQRVTEINVKSVDNLIEYIEGPSSKAVAEQKKQKELAAKKQLKKEKQQQQKIRRQIEQQVGELRVINGHLHDVGILIKQVQNQISQLKSNKSRNKESRRVIAAEEKLAELVGRRSKIESQVLGTVDAIKELNPDANIIDECIDMKAVMGIIAPDYTPPPPPVQAEVKPVAVAPPQSSTITVQRPVPLRATPPNSSQQQQQKQQQKQQQQQQNLPTSHETSKSAEDDPAKRMVTIRRVNLPHAEPQVTVTAKGTTPDMDQLLYTFVNGQLVPASNLPPNAFQNATTIQLYMSNNNGQTKTIVDHRSLQQLQALHQQRQQQQAQQSSQQKSSKQGRKDGVSKKETPVQDQPQAESKTNNTKKQQLQPQPQGGEKVSNKDNKKESKKNDSKKKDVAVAKESAKKDSKKSSKQEPSKSRGEESPAPAKRKVRKAYIDPEFAANPFKLLDDDDDDEEEYTTESDDEALQQQEAEELPDIASLSLKETEESSTISNSTKKKEAKVTTAMMATAVAAATAAMAPAATTTSTSVKKQQQNLQQTSQQHGLKSDKNAQKKQQQQVATQQQVVNQRATKAMERQDSMNSATSSNNSKDTKQSKKQKGGNNKNLQQQEASSAAAQAASAQAYAQSFPLHPQYQPTVYQPADYMRKPTITPQPSHQIANSNSIMDQLNRGVHVEGLLLPPGITLTKVSPSGSSNTSNTARRDSINRIVQPMQDYSQHHQQQQQRMSMDEHMMFSQGRDPNGIIMVESNPHAAHSQQQQQPLESSNGKKNKKKKKSKGDGNDASNKLNQQSNSGVSGSNMSTNISLGGGGGGSSGSGSDRMVTLKNPNHHNNPETMMMSSMMRNLQTPPSFISPMMDSPQQQQPHQASIIKNENGMYTIRNPAFQNVFGSSPSSSSSISAASTSLGMQQSSSPASTATTNASGGYGNGMTNSNASPYITHSTIVDSSNRPPYMPNSFACEHELMQPPQQHQQLQQQPQPPKCSSVIGSEMRNLIQRRKEQEYSAHMDPYGLRQSSHYSHFGGSGVSFSPASANCDENFMSRPPPSSYQSYSSPSLNYDDLRLQPGKMLNSEVTIHNVTESKFFQNQAKTQAPIGTPRNITNSSSSSSASDAAAAKLFGGSELLVQPSVVAAAAASAASSSTSSIIGRPPHASAAAAAASSTEFNGSESGLYHGRNSIDIENEERDIEMFRQFDMNYVPPKQKMKCNINMNEILVNPKKSTLTHAMTDEFDKRQTSSTNSNSPSSLASSSLDELYEKTPSYYATHHNLTDEKSSAASSLFSSSNGM